MANATSDTTADWRALAEEMVREALKPRKVEALPLEIDLTDLGIDSLGMLGLLIRSEKRLGGTAQGLQRNLPDMSRLRTFGQLCSYLEQRSHALAAAKVGAP